MKFKSTIRPVVFAIIGDGSRGGMLKIQHIAKKHDAEYFGDLSNISSEMQGRLIGAGRGQSAD